MAVKMERERDSVAEDLVLLMFSKWKLAFSLCALTLLVKYQDLATEKFHSVVPHGISRETCGIPSLTHGHCRKEADALVGMHY